MVCRAGRVRPSADLDRELAQRYLEALDPLIRAGRLSSFLLQLSPAFKPGAHELDELAPLLEALAPHPVAIEFRHRAWVRHERFAYKYSDDELREVEHRVENLAEDAGTVRVMFNNNRGADAPQSAQRFRDLLGQTTEAAAS